MLYDILAEYRFYLQNLFQEKTATTYYNRLKNLMQNQSIINTMQQLDIQKLITNLSKIKYKNLFSQSKNALFYFLEFNNIPIESKYLKQIEELEKSLIKKKRKLNEVSYTEIKNKLNHIRNKKLRLSFKTILITGLRVSELSQIKKSDCQITDSQITFSFLGKGGKKEQTKILKNEYVNEYTQIKKLLDETKEDKKIFYSANYLQQKANELNFECHDLRRIYSKLEYQKTHSKEEVKEKLRHSSMKTTDIYLNSKVKIDK